MLCRTGSLISAARISRTDSGLLITSVRAFFQRILVFLCHVQRRDFDHQPIFEPELDDVKERLTDALNPPQSAVTASFATLEPKQDLGLFYPIGRGIQLTGAGASVPVPWSDLAGPGTRGIRRRHPQWVQFQDEDRRVEDRMAAPRRHPAGWQITADQALLIPRRERPGAALSRAVGGGMHP